VVQSEAIHQHQPSREVRDGAVSCDKDNSTSLMLLTIMSEDVIYTVDVMNISKVKEELVSGLWHWR
jgi:hypothetical protein